MYMPAIRRSRPRRFRRSRSSRAPFIDDKKLLQREQKDDVPGWLWGGANVAVLALYVAFLTALAIGVGRVARSDPRRRGPDGPTKAGAKPPLTTPRTPVSA